MPPFCACSLIALASLSAAELASRVLCGGWLLSAGDALGLRGGVCA